MRARLLAGIALATLAVTSLGLLSNKAEAQFGVIGCQPTNQVPVPCVVDSAGRIVVVAGDTTNTTVATSTAAEATKVFATSAKTLAAIFVTTGAVSGYLMVFDATSAPADGAVTPKLCIAAAANNTVGFTYPTAFTTGISVAFSTTGCFTKTVSATATFTGYTY